MWQLLGVIISGLCMGGLAFAVRKFSKDRTPTWLTPAAAGLGMLGFLAYYDYTWYDFKRGQLVEQLAMKNLPAETYTVIAEDRKKDFFRPWSYLITPITSFSFIDDKALRFEQQGNQLVQYIQYKFLKEYVDKLETQTYLLNCSRAEQVKLDEQAQAVHPVVVEEVDREGVLYLKICMNYSH